MDKDATFEFGLVTTANGFFHIDAVQAATKRGDKELIIFLEGANIINEYQTKELRDTAASRLLDIKRDRIKELDKHHEEHHAMLERDVKAQEQLAARAKVN